MEFESKMMFRVFWFEKGDVGVKEALFESKEDAETFIDTVGFLRPECDLHLNKWSWKVLIEK